MAKSIGIVGAGTIGSGIARAIARAGYDVLVYDINDTVLRRAFELIKAEFKKLVAGGSATQEEMSAAIGLIHPRTSLADLRSCELVIEAVIEDLRIKKDLFKHLEAHVKPLTLLASATSSLS
ncbi:MAG: 3-hydroxyacyl-CoA dehydrogenase family protein, partial [Proteobacteria bacterium]|nr:3-hydroxyacyl-CoA dehydrogenase family protein [Pseudomonadota bacterium]